MKHYSACLLTALMFAFATLGVQIFFHGSSIGGITFQVLAITFLTAGITEKEKTK